MSERLFTVSSSFECKFNKYIELKPYDFQWIGRRKIIFIVHSIQAKHSFAYKLHLRICLPSATVIVCALWCILNFFHLTQPTRSSYWVDIKFAWKSFCYSIHLLLFSLHSITSWKIHMVHGGISSYFRYSTHSQTNSSLSDSNWRRRKNKQKYTRNIERKVGKSQQCGWCA